jgi:hypothetical protein
MQAKYDKAIAVGMAGVLLLFISLYLSSYVAGLGGDVGAGESSVDELLWGFTFIISTFCALFIIGIISSCVTYGDISSYRDAVEISSLAGAIPLSLVILVIAYLALHAGSSAYLLYAAIGLAIVIPGILFTAAGGIAGHAVFLALMKRKTVK